MNANVPMLDEIAGKNTKEVIDVLNETIRQQQAEIKLLKRNMNTATNELLQQQAEIEALKAKTLTDEEIWEIVQEQYGHSCGLYGNHIGFARAILRKAQEL